MNLAAPPEGGCCPGGRCVIIDAMFARSPRLSSLSSPLGAWFTCKDWTSEWLTVQPIGLGAR